MASQRVDLLWTTGGLQSGLAITGENFAHICFEQSDTLKKDKSRYRDCVRK